MINILVVEDDSELRDLFSIVLKKSGYATCEAANGQEALDLLESESVDLMVCDVMMPVMDGFELVRQVRGRGLDLPVLIVTAKGELTDKREGFRAGVDDYMVKPVDVREMVWRVEALLRRAHKTTDSQLEVGGTTLDSEALTVTCGGKQTALPQKEFKLLFKLLSSPGRVFTRQQLMDDVWGLDAEVDTHTLDVHISRLRERFRDNPDFEIVTVRGLGYKGVLANG